MNILAGVSNINYVGVLVACVVAFVFGMIWYSPLLFGNYWQRVTGVSQEYPRYKMFPAMINGFVMMFIGAMIVALLVGGAGLMQGLQIGALIGVLIMTSMLSGATYELKPLRYKLIAAGYILIVWTLVGGLTGYF